MVPFDEISAYVRTLSEAARWALSGDAMAGYKLLLARLQRAEWLQGEGLEWAELLVRWYAEAREGYADRWDMAAGV
jgi:hypothetical protein